MHSFSLLLKLAALAGAQCLASQSICRARDSMPDPAARGPVLRMTSVWHNFAVKDRCGCVEQLLGADDDPRNSGLCQYRGFCIARKEDSSDSSRENICDAQDLSALDSTILSHNFTQMHFCDFSQAVSHYSDHAETKCNVEERAQTRIESWNGLLPVTQTICVPPFSGLLTGDYSILGGHLDVKLGIQNKDRENCLICSRSDLKETSNYQEETGKNTNDDYEYCSETAYDFFIMQEILRGDTACQPLSNANQVMNARQPMQYIAYNPIIPASRAWSCGFAEIASRSIEGNFGKVCGKNKRSTGRLLAHLTCPQLSDSFNRSIHRSASFAPTKHKQTMFEHSFEDWIGRFHPFILNKLHEGPKTELMPAWNTFAEWNRFLLSRKTNWLSPDIYNDPDYRWERKNPAHINMRRTPVAHAFAMWEGKARVVQEGLDGGPGDADQFREWVDHFYSTENGGDGGGADPRPRTNASDEDRLVAWIDVDCVEALALFHNAAQNVSVDFSSTDKFPDTDFLGVSSDKIALGRTAMYRRAGEACYRRSETDWDWGGCVVYNWGGADCAKPTDTSRLRDVENCVAEDSNERVEAIFDMLAAVQNPEFSTIVPPPVPDRFDDLCTKTELDYSGNTPDPRTHECLENDGVTYLAVCCQGVQATPDDASSAPRPTMRNFYPPSELTRENAAIYSFDVQIPPLPRQVLRLHTVHATRVAVASGFAEALPDASWSFQSTANFSDLLHPVHGPVDFFAEQYAELADCTCRATEIVDYVPIVVAEPDAQVLYTHPDDEAVCATFTHFANCTDHCTLCASRCKFFCADDFFGNGELDAPFLLVQNRTRFVRTCRPQTEVCTADRLPPLLPEQHPVAPPPRLTVHDVDAASLVARDLPAVGWAYALRSSDAAHTHNSMQCPMTEDCKHKVRIYDLPTHYIPGRFYSVLRATGVRLQSPSHLFSELDALTHQRCEQKCWELGLHACSWFAVAPGGACYLGDANISHALRADMPLCHGTDCAPFLAHMDSRYVVMDTEAQQFRVYGMAAYLAHTHRVPSIAQNREGLREVQAFSLDAHDCAALCAHDLRCTRFAAWDDGVCAVDGPGEGNFTDVPGEETVMQVGLENVETVEICVDGVSETKYQQFYRNDSVLSCAQNAAREPVAQTCQECPADENAEWPWCGDFFFALCDRCIACPDGQIRPVGEDECRYCTRQEFYDIATGECVECLPHHRRSDDSPFRCEPCALEDAKCKRCPESTARDLRYALRSASTLGEVCVPCPDDAVGETTNACACAPGWMLDKAQGECVACPRGTAKAQYGDDACKACLPGTAASETGAARCEQCLRDRGPGITSTVQCLPAVFAQNAEQECTEDAGKVMVSLENGQGFVCLPQAVAEVQEVPCREGFERVEVMPGVHVCLPCGLGWFRDNTTAACVPCRQLGVNYSRTTCEDFEACLHWATVGDAVAGLAARWDLVPQVEQGSRGPDEVVCEDGHVRDQKHNVCVGCAEGFEANGEACVPCGPGNWTVPGLAGCRPCPGNMTSRMPEGCVCREGEAPGEGGQCVKCAQGFFKQVAGNASCVECLREWEVTIGEGAVSCAECPEYAKPLGNTSRCVCGPGFVMGVEGVCEKCARGKVSIGFEDADECEECPAGKFERERAKCVKCVVGKYSTSGQEGQTSCISCVPGSFADREGSSKCSKCDTGKFAPSTASFDCELCKIGKFQDKMGQTTCNECEIGKYLKHEVARLAHVWHNFALRPDCGCEEQLLASDDNALNSGLCLYMGMCVPRMEETGSRRCHSTSMESFLATLNSGSMSSQHFCDLSDLPSWSASDIANRFATGCDVNEDAKRTTYWSDSADPGAAPLPRLKNICRYYSGMLPYNGPWNPSGKYLDIANTNLNRNMKEVETCRLTKYQSPETRTDLGSRLELVQQSAYHGATFARDSDYVYTGADPECDCNWCQGWENRASGEQYIAYNPLIHSKRAWSCGFVEVASANMRMDFGKVCGKNRRASGRLLAKRVCPKLSSDFDSNKHSFASFTPTPSTAPFIHTFEDMLGQYHTATTYTPADLKDQVKTSAQWRTFAEYNRRLLTRRSDYSETNPLRYIIDEKEEENAANVFTSRTHIAHAFSIWEGVPRHQHEFDEKISSSPPIRPLFKDFYFGNFTATNEEHFRRDRSSETEERLVLWIDVKCTQSMPLRLSSDPDMFATFNSVSHPTLTDPRTNTTLRRRTAEACHWESVSDKDYTGCVVYDKNCLKGMQMMPALTDEWNPSIDAEHCVLPDSNEIVEIIFAMLDREKLFIIPLYLNTPQTETFDSMCTYRELTRSSDSNIDDARNYECLEKNDETYLSICCQGIQLDNDGSTVTLQESFNTFKFDQICSYQSSEINGDEFNVQIFNVPGVTIVPTNWTIDTVEFAPRNPDTVWRSWIDSYDKVRKWDNYYHVPLADSFETTPEYCWYACYGFGRDIQPGNTEQECVFVSLSENGCKIHLKTKSPSQPIDNLYSHPYFAGGAWCPRDTIINSSYNISIYSTANFLNRVRGFGVASKTDVQILPYETFSPFVQKWEQSACYHCPIGKFQNKTGQTKCEDCLQGFVTQTTASTSLNDCIV